jgi:homoserine dehydrogenase
VTRFRPIVLAFLAIAAIAVGGYIAYDQVLRGDDVATLALPSDVAPSAVPTTEAAATSGAAASAEPGAEAGVAGEWQVADDSVAGYRVREQLANLPAESDAVGRTSDVTGSITVEENGDGTRLTAGTLTVDTTTITSD